MSRPTTADETIRPPTDRDGSNCFVVISGEGLYWSGEGWVSGWQDALQFRFPDPDPWLSCHDLCVGLRERLGVYCTVAHISPAGLTPARRGRSACARQGKNEAG
jgi:hypothetical protein